MKYFRFLIIATISLIFISCANRNKNPNADSERPSVAVTQWGDKMELFMEYPIMVKDTPGKFIIHLTHLENFKPVRDGSVNLSFIHSSGTSFEVRKDSLLREGIFTPVATLPLSGSYNFTLRYTGPKVQDSFVISGLVVYETSKNIPEQAENGEELISFLKEQQWKSDFRTEPVRKRSIGPATLCVAEVLPQQKSYAEIVAPIEGVITSGPNYDLAIPGNKVEKGQVVAAISTPLGADNSWAAKRLAYEQAKKDYERAQRLKQHQAISNREFEEIERNYLTQKAGFNPYIEWASDELDIMYIRAPIKGVVAQVEVQPGKKVGTGQKLMSIVNPELVWLKINLFEKDYYQLGKINGMRLKVPGLEKPVDLEASHFKILSRGGVLHPETRTVPLFIEVNNSQGLLKVGQTLSLELYSGRKADLLSVPESALFDEEGQPVVFVQIEGESFERRAVKTGGKNMSWVAIVQGLTEGERVVSQGGYQVKLASTTSAIGHPHSH